MSGSDGRLGEAYQRPIRPGQPVLGLLAWLAAGRRNMPAL